MATITAVETLHVGYDGNNGKSYAPMMRVIWETVGDDDTGTSVEVSAFADKTVTVTGTFGAGTVTLQGSNDNTVWFTLTDGIGNNVAFTAAGMKLIAENPRYIRAISASGSSNDTDVIVWGRLVV